MPPPSRAYPIPRHDWTIRWSLEAGRIHPDMSLRFATAVALTEFVQHGLQDPVEAARAWCAAHAAG